MVIGLCQFYVLKCLCSHLRQKQIRLKRLVKCHTRKSSEVLDVNHLPLLEDEMSGALKLLSTFSTLLVLSVRTIYIT